MKKKNLFIAINFFFSIKKYFCNHSCIDLMVEVKGKDVGGGFLMLNCPKSTFIFYTLGFMCDVEERDSLLSAFNPFICEKKGDKSLGVVLFSKDLHKIFLSPFLRKTIPHIVFKAVCLLSINILFPILKRFF